MQLDNTTAHYCIDIIALSETRLADEGSIAETGGGFTLFWKDISEADEWTHIVGFAVGS